MDPRGCQESALEQRLRHRRVLRPPLPQPQQVLAPVGRDPQRDQQAAVVSEVVLQAADRFQHPTRGRNELWQTDFTYLPVVGWGWYYLSTVLDDYSRKILAWKLSDTMRVEDVTETLDLARAATGVDRVRVEHKPRLLSDNGPCYVAKDLAAYLKESILRRIESASGFADLIQLEKGLNLSGALARLDEDEANDVPAAERDLRVIRYRRERGTVSGDRGGGHVPVHLGDATSDSRREAPRKRPLRRARHPLL